ncbi:MAG: FKBP-type peptidyl-prolyl cis-trans isomerase [Candidatus Bathyarchaeota archaeon]
MVVEKGNHVKVHVTVKVEDDIFYSSYDGDPIEFNVGEGKVLRGLDEAVIGLEKGEKKSLKIPPEGAYGQRREKLLKKLPRDSIDVPSEQIQEGAIIESGSEQGEPRLATIRKIGEDGITVDFNHPLAGQTLDFELEIVDVQK